ncbi:p-type calcium ATPase [Colletotrichum karsti]|uniref:Calcium-transporting ATPase n=1 Tax=Colletotrichum karsti TaxID=1095194 RepID=A0A9P6IAR9_9PEZI|nr:p-type calcium ATPase [Colletotrichum karsti]KAF9879095.1 p-type calcium ATPase [Colletotrichum karsti]
MATANNQDAEKGIGIAEKGDHNSEQHSQDIESEKTKDHHESQGFRLDTADALTPDPGTEDMFNAKSDKFAFSPGQLSKLLNPKSLNAFYALGGLAGLEKGLRTNRKTGLSVDENTVDGTVSFEEAALKGAPKYGTAGDSVPQRDPNSKTDIFIPPPPSEYTGGFSDRKHTFRDNTLPDKKQKSFLQLLWITYNDKILILLSIAAIVSFSLGLYQSFGPQHEPNEPRVDWVEGVAIMVAIILVVFVGAINDWNMQRQFNNLNKKNDDRTVKVIRSGKSVEISVHELVVGDVMHLNTGDIVPVDAIFIDGHGVKCDESSATGESDLLKKTAADEVSEALDKVAHDGASQQKVEKLDPFIISGSKIQEGTGTCIVTAVGVNSSYGRITMSLRTEQEETPLQRKLNILADFIAKVGGAAALLLFVVLFIKFLVNLKNLGSADAKGQAFMKIFITCVTIVVVAVPEGLPLAVTLALSFATNRMMKDNNLVRVLKACETMGNATTVCSDKTGTLTQNKMTVVATTLGKSVSFGGTDAPLEEPTTEKSAGGNSNPNAGRTNAVSNVSLGDFTKSLSQETKQLVIQGNAVNSTAFEGDDEGEKTFIGSKTEVALLTFCRDQLGAGPVEEERTNSNVVQVVPFDSAVKYMATVVKLPDGKYRAYVKGASEILLDKCTKVLDDAKGSDLNVVDLTSEDCEMFSQTISSYAGQTLRTIGSSFRDFESWPPKEAVSSDDPKAADFNKIHEDMTLIAIYGIKDPLRPTVIDAINDCTRAGVVVRMVTGDNILTGKAIAKECGIYHPEDGGIAMEGPEFRRKSEEELKEIVPRLQVLARSSPDDKRILVRTLKDLGETVAVTGDGTNDAPALKLADIGFSMGIAGTEVAKEASEIILMDDNFASIVKGMMWGRAINDSVKKFLQFQLTVNVTAVVLTFITAAIDPNQQSVLNAVQLLWVNLIMDTFAALALATDPPTRSVLDRKPERKSAPLITLRMAKMIIGQAIVQLVITIVLKYVGEAGGLWYPRDGDRLSDNNQRQLNTLVFNTFVWLQIFNELNNRRLDNKLNVFENITKNWFFIGINLIMIGGQILIIFVGGDAFVINRLDGREWGASIGLGAISLPLGALIRLFPDNWVGACMPWFIRKKWAPESISEKRLEEHREFAEGKEPPLRALTGLRGNRAQTHIPFRQKMHDAKVKAKKKAHLDRALFKNNFSMLGFVFATGFAFEMGFNGAMNKYWDYLNRGRQWKDIRHKYVEAGGDEDDE